MSRQLSSQPGTDASAWEPCLTLLHVSDDWSNEQNVTYATFVCRCGRNEWTLRQTRTASDTRTLNESHTKNRAGWVVAV